MKKETRKRIEESPLMLFSITFFKEDEESGEQIHYDYEGDCSCICDMIDDDELKEVCKWVYWRRI